MSFLIAIVGLGYVGLPLSLQLSRSGVCVLGLDIDGSKVSALNEGHSHIQHIESREVAEQVSTGRFSASLDFSRVREMDAVIICGPTPLGKNSELDVSYILETGRSIAPHLRQGQLIVLESTTFPGTGDEDLKGVLEAGSGLKAGIDFHLAFSPEHEDPDAPHSVVATLPKVRGGLTPICLDRVRALYRLAIRTLVHVFSRRVVEATKLLETIFRSVNITLVNRLQVVYAAIDLDIWKIIQPGKIKPFGFMPFYPRSGLAGQWIPINLSYLMWKTRECGQATRSIELAGEISTAILEWVIQKAPEALKDRCKAVKGSRVLVRCLSNKANVDVRRESRTFVWLDQLCGERRRVWML
jgi:UDP-N-acetyl-D-glucosamine dehydrogenase